MPVCICGSRVERHQFKVQCILCNQFFHASCYNFKQEELDLVKNKFKCTQCSRRASTSINTQALSGSCSRSSTDTAAVMGLTESNTNEFVNNSLVDIPVSAAANTNSFDAGVIDTDINSDNNIDVAEKNYVKSKSAEFSSDNALHNAIDTSNACVSNSHLTNTKNITMELLYNELTSIKHSYEELKGSNLTLKELVISLVNDNNELVHTVNEMSDEIKKLNNTLSQSLKTFVSSPKRKKSTSMKSDCLDSAKNLSMPLSLIPTINEKSNNKPSPSLTFAAVAKSSNVDIINTSSVLSPKLPEVLDSGVPIAYQQVKSKNMKQSIVVGVNDSKELGVVERKKWLHLSSFNSSVTAKDISSYIAKHAGVIEQNIACFALIKKDTNLQELKFVNFKVGVVESDYNKVFNASLWPANVKVRPFNFLNKIDVTNLAI